MADVREREKIERDRENERVDPQEISCSENRGGHRHFKSIIKLLGQIVDSPGMHVIKR